VKRALALVLLLAAATLVGLVSWLVTSSGADARTARPYESEARLEQRHGVEVAVPLDATTADAAAAADHREPRATNPFVTASGPVGSLCVQAVWKSNGEPAANVGIQLMRKNRPIPLLDAESFTDADGTALFAGLEFGALIIRSNRGAQTTAQIARGKRTVVRLEIEGAYRVAGRVTTRDGQGAQHAKIWINADDDWIFLAECDSAGDYNVAGVPWGSRLIATADAFAPSHSTSVPNRVGSEQREDFVLGGEAPSVRVQVLDAHGAPVPRAVATLESGPRDSPEASVRWTKVCDEHGRLAYSGVSPGDVFVTVQAAGFAAVQSFWNVMPGCNLDHIVRLERAATVVGEVRLDGRPVAQATVLVGFDDCRPIACMLTTNADGEVRVDGLSAGRYRLLAVTSPSPPPDAEPSLAPSTASETLEAELAAGQTMSWRAELRRWN